jgi:hypothetical protein
MAMILVGSFDDWRLPNINELLILVDVAEYDPARREDLFRSGSDNGIYWSSTIVTDGLVNGF